MALRREVRPRVARHHPLELLHFGLLLCTLWIARILRHCLGLLRPVLRLHVLLTKVLYRGLDAAGFAELQL